MCGIGGILRTDGEPIPEEWLDAIDARIAYRGPDGAGRFRDKVEITDEHGEQRIVEVAFVHRRLSIIDHEDGAQPMVSNQGRNESEGLVAVVFNGCIYNHRELRLELQAKGHTFVTDHSDTEVLIHGWREWKEKLIDHLEGMYAFAIWDRASATLVLSRDWCGRKPLFHGPVHLDDDPNPCLMFSSDAKSLGNLMAEFEVTDKFIGHEDVACKYLQLGYYPMTETPFSNQCVFSIQAGEQIASSAGVEALVFAPRPESETEAEIETVELQIEQAVKRRLEADVPLGCFLSGGVDSSLIAYFAKQHKPDLQTYSVRMPDERYDESKHAELIAKHLGTNHTTLEVSMNPVEDLVHLINTLGQPFGDSSILPTYWVSKAASKHVKVALSGDGGDELFIGYERYLAAPVLAKLHFLLTFLPTRFFLPMQPKSALHKLGRLGGMAKDYKRLGILSMESIFLQKEISLLSNHHSFDPVQYKKSEGAAGNALSSLRWCDTQLYLTDDLLRKVDTASMACALEVRCPFLDRDLARTVLAMPIEQLIPGGKRKGLLRNIARKYLPAECVDRPKMGFAIPIGEWFRSDFGGMKTLLLDHLESTNPFGPIELNQKVVKMFIDEHMTEKRDHSHRLFTLLTLSIWARQVPQ